MKVFAALLTLALLGSISAVPAKKDLAGDIKDIVTLIFNLIPETLEKKDLTLTIPENDYVSGELVFNDLSLTKLHDITIDDISQEDKTLTFAIHFDDIVAHSDSTLSFTVLDTVSITNHELLIDVDLQKLSLVATAVLTDDEESLSDFSLKVHLEGSEISTEGVLGDDALSSKLGSFLSTFVPETTNAIADAVAAEYSVALKNLINNIIGQINA